MTTPDTTTVRELPRTIGFWGGWGIMAGIMIGGGIFATPASIARELSSPALILVLWAVGGVVALFGGLTYAELATMYPQSGGVYVFLREGFGRATAFVFGWTYLLITKPLGAAGIAMIFSNHFVGLMGWDGAREGAPLWHDPRVVTIVLLTLLTWINVRGMRLGSGVAVALTSVKFLVLVAIVLVALALMKGSEENLRAAPEVRPLLGALVPVMAAIFWTYDGWSDVGAVAGEVREPGRTLPRVFFAGTFFITLVYIAVNLVYMWMIPLSEMRERETIAPLVMERLLGPAGGVAVTVMILVSTLGSTHGSIITGARVSYQQARDGLLFRDLGRVHRRYETPAVSLWVQLLLSCVCVWFLRTFENLAGGFIFTMWIFYGLAAAAVIVLRVRRPEVERAFRCPGYPAVPAVFVLVAAGMTVLSLAGDPGNFVWVGLLALGVPAYWVWRWVGVEPETDAG